MNNTISSFSNFNKYKTIPILAIAQNKSNDNEYNYSNHLNQIDSVLGSQYTNKYLQTENNSRIRNIKYTSQNFMGSLNHLSVKKKKVLNNNINILQFNNNICSKTVNNNFTGKKILLSKYPLFNRNRILENEKNKNIKYLLYKDGKDNKTLEINSTFFDKNIANGYFNINKGDFFSTKIEKELNDILNKNKNYKKENNNDSHKNKINNESYNLINQNNESREKNNNENNENYFLKESKINNEQNLNILNTKNKRNDLFNQYFNSNIIKRKVLFIDKYNQTLSNDNTITLLGGEKDLLLEKYYNHRDDKGNDINLPLLQRYKKGINQNVKFLTEYNNNKEHQNNITTEQTQSSSLSQLIKNRFTKQNYKNVKIAGTTEYNHYNPNNRNVHNNEKEIKKDIDKETITFNNFYLNGIKVHPEKGRKRRKNDKPNPINDILGVIKAKPIGPKTKKKKKQVKSPNKKVEKEKKKKKRKLKRLLSQPKILTGAYHIPNNIFFDNEKEIKSLINVPLTVKDTRGKKIKVTLVKKKEKIIPINEEGDEIKNAVILSDLYEEIKKRLRSEEVKKLLPKRRLSANLAKKFENPLKILDLSEEKSDISKTNEEDIKNKDNDNLQSIKDNFENEKKEKIKQLKINESVKKNKSILLDNNKSQKSYNSSKNQEKSIDKKQNKENKTKKVKINEDDFYQEKDDFVKDFNFEFYSSEEESNSLSYQKLIRIVKKKINKYLFQIFEFIAKNADIDNFKKEDLIKFLIDKDFRNNFRLLKEQIIKLRELDRDALDPEGKDKKKKIYIKDTEMINYIYRYIKDKNSLFYKSIYKRIKKEQEEKRQLNREGNYDKLVEMLKQSTKEEKKKRNFSLYSQRRREYSEDSPTRSSNSKKFKKKKGVTKDLEFISQDEKKLLLLGEINLTNEIRYQISISNDRESKEKFKNLLNKIESLRSLTGDEYVKSLKKNFLMFKDEADEILKAKEIEERLNGFIDDLNYQRNNLKDKHKFIMSSMFIKDNKFLSSFENELSE